MSRQCWPAFLKTYDKSMTPEKQPSSTTSLRGWMWTLLPFRKQGWQTRAPWRRMTTHSTGKERAPTSHGNTEWALQWETPCWVWSSQAASAPSDSSLSASTPTQAPSPLSACTPQHWPQHRTPRTSSMRASQPPSAVSPARNSWSSWATSISEWALITTRGPHTLGSSEWVGWMRMASDYSSCALSTTCASQTLSSRPRSSTRSPGDTHAQSTGTS